MSDLYLKLRKRFFLAELKLLFLESFQGSQTQFQSKILVILWMDVYVTADLYQAKRPYKPKINMLLLVREWFTVLHLEQLFEILVEEMKLDTDVLTLLKKHSLCNLNWSCFEHTVACANVTMLRLYVFENYWEISRGWIFTNIYNRTKIQKWLIGW